MRNIHDLSDKSVLSAWFAWTGFMRPQASIMLSLPSQLRGILVMDDPRATLCQVPRPPAVTVPWPQHREAPTGTWESRLEGLSARDSHPLSTGTRRILATPAALIERE